MPSITLPNTTCLPSSHSVFAVHRKNWLPFVFGPALAMLRMPSPSCVSSKFSSANLEPKIDSPPVPFPAVKSPPWHMNPGMTRWKALPLKCRSFPLLPSPFSPVQSARKFSHVLGTTSPRSSMVIRPRLSPSASMSKYTLKGSLCLTSMRSMLMSSMSNVSSFPARGWLASMVTSSPSTAVISAGVPGPTMSLVPTLTFSSPTPCTTCSFGTVRTFSSDGMPYASSGESVNFLVSPTAMPETFLSKPAIICPAPTVNEMGSPRGLDASNCVPSSRVPS
mmetsp:Transcript_6204/g.14136  ORF Transcript_6204/g.14136 Transcript_6204/m.14136 type:complete len:278 (-) Transcript_6204:233-1066(-)